MKYYALKLYSKLKYERHLMPKLQTGKFIWGFSVELKWFSHRIELRIVDRKIARELFLENEF